MTDRICAIIVTYNRKALLQECLQALLAQTYTVSQILVVDNASTDGTDKLFSGAGDTKGTSVRYLRLDSNRGGAGGFHHGMKIALEGEYDWLWLMDDDTIPQPAALRQLIETREIFPEGKRPDLLASKVEWEDGQLHAMNFPSLRRATRDPERTVLAAQYGTLWLRAVSFVSVLIHRSAVQQYGLPTADYFIWNDDIEYTARILRHRFGVYVPASIVLHRTAQSHSAMDAPPQRAFYQVRNVLWMILRSPAWAPDERLKIGVLHLYWIARYLWRSRFRVDALSAVWSGVVQGITQRPQR